MQRDGSHSVEARVVLLIILALVLVALVRYGAFGEVWRTRFTRAIRPALVLGGIAFAAGFFGPMIFVPGANQGPLLGIFITGPAGFLAGLLWGVGRELFRA
jgi:hypothetical protein